MDPTVQVALIGAAALLLGTIVGHLLGGRQRKAGTELTETQADELQGQIYERLLKRLREELAERDVTIDQLRHEVAELRVKIETYSVNEQRLQVENASLREQVASAQASAQAKDLEISRLVVALAQAQPPATPTP